MSQVDHIINHRRELEARSQIIRLIREWFWSQGFLEVDPPAILRLPGQEPHLSPMKLAIHDERGNRHESYLHTSPEYACKKMLAAGLKKIFSLGKVYRDCESFGGTHNPEFTMIEWYRSQADFYAIMDDVEELFQFIILKLRQEVSSLKSVFERLHMREIWQTYAGVNLDEYLDREKMFVLCEAKGYKPKSNEPYEDLFYRIFLNEIEPNLGKDSPVIVHHYPAAMAALARLSPTDPRYAERFEVYVGGLELANCFSELTDADEQLLRLEQDREERKALGRETFEIDMEFINALKTMPPAAGIALGVDRLVQLFTGCKNIDDVLILPASLLFSS